MEVRGDQRVQPGGLLRVEPEAASVVAWSPDAQPLEDRDDPLARLAGQRFVVEDRLALAPPSVGAGKGAVVAIPHRDPTGVQAVEHRSRREAPGTAVVRRA